MFRLRIALVGFVFGTLGFAAGLYVAGGPATADEAPPPRNVNKESPPNRSLDANLWMQTSAEYRACCYQAYNVARRRLIEKLRDAPPGGWAKPPAVVLDLDETVLDNSAFMTRLARNGLTFDEKTWDDFEKNSFNEVRLIPGAKAFFDEAKRLGVKIVYISNRSQKQELRDGTLNALELLGIEVAGRDLLCAEETSDKTARRADAENRYTVLLWLGDNLRDFHDGEFRSTIDNTRSGKGSNDIYALRSVVDRRALAVDRCSDLFGREWIIFPNPSYGEWMKVAGRGELDKELLTGQPRPR